MSVVMGAVRSHKGAIYISSQPHYGTTISLLFPVAAAKPAPVAPALARQLNFRPPHPNY